MIRQHVLNVSEIDDWVVTPYKRPERDLPDNETFNKQVSMLRIRSEHAISFLKGRFQSLRDLRTLIQDEKTHKSAVYWVVACISVHSFATRCELGRRVDDHDLADDPFVTAGLSPTHDDNERTPPTGPNQGSARLARGREKREQLKAAWMAESALREDGEYV